MIDDDLLRLKLSLFAPHSEMINNVYRIITQISILIYEIFSFFRVAKNQMLQN